MELSVDTPIKVKINNKVLDAILDDITVIGKPNHIAIKVAGKRIIIPKEAIIAHL